MKSFTVSKSEKGLTAIKYCRKVCKGIPESLLHKYFRKKRIKINGKKRSEDSVLQAEDYIEIYINDEFFKNGENASKIPRTAKIPPVVYEDENIIIIRKPRGLLCHSDNKAGENLVDEIRRYLAFKGEYDGQSAMAFKPSLCNRLDQGTEGLVTAAKNYNAQREINSLIKVGGVVKKYLCLTENKVEDGEYTAFISRDKISKTSRVSLSEEKDSKKIVTAFKTIASKKNAYLTECTLITGRTHQIRSHLAFLGCPIIGDRKYSKPARGVKNQLLCAYKIKFENIPDDYTVSYLSGREFSLEDNCVTKFFEKL